jgi:hypothetical protein
MIRSAPRRRERAADHHDPGAGRLVRAGAGSGFRDQAERGLGRADMGVGRRGGRGLLQGGPEPPHQGVHRGAPRLQRRIAVGRPAAGVDDGGVLPPGAGLDREARQLAAGFEVARGRLDVPLQELPSPFGLVVQAAQASPPQEVVLPGLDQAQDVGARRALEVRGGSEARQDAERGQRQGNVVHGGLGDLPGDLDGQGNVVPLVRQRQEGRKRRGAAGNRSRAARRIATPPRGRPVRPAASRR